ncbi:hypothetical protein LCGC14_3132010, partial [marine sediment metagenome]
MENKKTEICPICKGSGQRLVPIVLKTSHEIIMIEQVCITCKGTGKV